jgi:putative glutamine amidotransferase
VAKPLIGLTGRRWPAAFLGDNVPFAMRELTFDLHFSDYPKSVSEAGGLPVELARDADVAGMVERLDGIVFSGGADLDPALYGAERDAELGQLEHDRDEWEMTLFMAARAVSMPILAICRGFQLVNVAFGGTLTQHVDIDEGAGHPQWNVDGRKTTHEVNVVEGTLASKILPASWSVNSLHHQTVSDVGAGLIVSARATDGVVEGLETPEGDLVAVQWHPELLAKPDPTFQWLVREASRRLAS